MHFKRNLFFIFFSFLVNSTLGQYYNLDGINYSNLRNKSLLSNDDSLNSFVINENSFFNEQKEKRPIFSLLPFFISNQFNTIKEFGANNGALLQDKGYQTLLRAGANIKFGVLETQIAPEILYVNSKSYAKVFPGQSFIKLHLGSISLGVSSENLWWGPGINTSLLMSNNAPGFLHGFIGTNKPIKTPIGYFEFKLIGANLNSDKSLPYENNFNQPLNINDNWRYLSSYVISWQPKWVKGLFLGMTRSLQQYGQPLLNSSSGILSKYVPVIGLSLQKKLNAGDDSLNRDQLASFFLRWVLPKVSTEFYLEFGKNDYGLNFRDYLMAPSHSYAYTVGLRKLIPQTKTKYIQLESELTQISQSPDALTRWAGNWYVHGQVLQGYTHQNQILGSGAGFGANVISASVTWIDGDTRNGILLQRVERDPLGRQYNWTDFSIGWLPQFRYKNMFLGAKIQLIRSNNYNWENKNNSFNLHSRLMIQYNFK